MNKTYQYNQIVNTYDSIESGSLSPVAPLKYFQEAAQRQLESLGLGIEYLLKNHLGWILVKYEIEYHEFPNSEEEVIVETEPTGINRFEAYRKFKLLSLDGKELITGKSVWMLINTETQKLMRINEVNEIVDSLGITDPEIIRIPRLKKVEDFDSTQEYQVKYFDIDINKHVNNVNYVTWALETLPFEILSEEKIKKITIYYKEQAYYNEKVKIKTKEVEPDHWRVNIVNNEDVILCEIDICG